MWPEWKLFGLWGDIPSFPACDWAKGAGFNSRSYQVLKACKVVHIEDLLDETYQIKEQRMTDALKTGEPALDHKVYYYRCTSAMTHRYRELIPALRIPLDDCQKLKQGVTVTSEGFNVDMTEEMFLKRFASFKDGRCDFGYDGIVGIKLNYKEEQDKFYVGGVS